MKRFLSAVAITAVALGGSSACATKKMVKQRVGEVDNKVDTLSKSVEENPGADAHQRRAHRRGRSEGHGRGSARRGGGRSAPTRPTARPAK